MLTSDTLSVVELEFRRAVQPPSPPPSPSLERSRARAWRWIPERAATGHHPCVHWLTRASFRSGVVCSALVPCLPVGALERVPGLEGGVELELLQVSA